jgi:ribulose-5-phosphate 4-epimerase/fuculose-1-phosphate aldolase
VAPDTSHASDSVCDRVSEAEWQERVNLAAVYRLIARFGWDDGIFTHNSARVPGHDDQILINPYGYIFSEITASSLVKIDLEGTIIDGGEDSDFIDAGYVIHSAVHAARADVRAVCHTHTIAGMAVSAQADGLLPLTQTSMRFYDRLAYHDYEGIADDIDERERLVEDLGSCRSMILRNHGLLTTGRSIAEAFDELRYLQRACESQIAAQAGGGDLLIPAPEVCEHTAQQFDNEGDNQTESDPSFTAMKRMLDRDDPSYAT